MKSIFFTLVLFIVSLSAWAQEEKMKPELTEDWSRNPEKIPPGEGRNAPSDAILLFDSKNLEEWVNAGDTAKAPTWYAFDDVLVCNPKTGSIKTTRKFGSCQLHIEWKSPAQDVIEGKKSQGCGNSGVFLMGKYEVQVLNSFANETYYNGMAGSIYKQHIPLVNPAKQVEQWQTYDIIFTAPEFNEDKTLKTPAYVTLLWNGVLVQNHVEIKGPTEYRGYHEYKYQEDK